MKARHSFPSGQTSAARLKALLGCLEAKKGTAVADAWLAKIRIARNDLADETRRLPLIALHSAVKAFLVIVPDGLESVAAHLTGRENLGVWARVLRGTKAPEEAFTRVESSESDEARSTRWETIAASPGHWRGRVHIIHDPSLEEDGLLAKIRQLELSILPTLFGFERGVVALRSANDEAQEFEVRWPLPTTTRGATTGAVAGLLAGGTAVLAHPSPIAMGAAAVLALVGGGAGFAWSSGKARRIDAAAQSMRVSALERSLVLRDREDRGGGDLEGAVIAGQYRIGERMGSGASGVIYEAMRITDGTPVAIKLLRAATAHDVTASDRLRRESEALGLSWHPNVVEVFDHGHLPDGTSYLAMELLRGETLATRLKHRVRLRPAEILPIAKQVTEALVAIHAAGVVHRDLKPSNIYLVKEEEGQGEGELVKVFDFGIARVEWEEMRITNIGAPLGTPGYMSPEQESGVEIDARSDIYAVGALLYECLVGEPPPPSSAAMWKPGSRPLSSFAMRLADARTDSGVQPASRRMASAAPSEVLPVPEMDAPPEWRAIIERAVAKHADDRFQDARSLLAALRAVEQPPVIAGAAKA